MDFAASVFYYTYAENRRKLLNSSPVDFATSAFRYTHAENRRKLLNSNPTDFAANVFYCTHAENRRLFSAERAAGVVSTRADSDDDEGIWQPASLPV